jgi:two-component system response regulator (stage 0 sporulation protein F)
MTMTVDIQAERTSGATRQPTALLADDDVDLALAIADVLRAEGFSVQVVTDGIRALEGALSSEPDVVLLDQRMPQLTGREVFEALRVAGFRAPVVLMTAAEDVLGLSRALGVEHFLGKPFAVMDLVGTVRRALSWGKPA